MRKLSVFNFITLNGFYKGLNNEIDWHKHGGEEAEFSAKNSQSGNILLFGRVTYDMMFGFWPSPMAYELFPIVAEGMNNCEKIVFSKSMKKAKWKNTSVINDNIIEEVKKLKKSKGNDLTILGSGTIVSLLTDAGLIDEYSIMIDPVAIGGGTPIFSNIKQPLNLKLKNSKVFKSGTLLLNYEAGA